jgi:hypothetical protein
MGTLHGKDSVVYMGVTTAVRITEAAEWSIDVDFDTDPDPALCDAWESSLKGLMRWSGSFSGNFDDAQETLWDSTLSASPSKFYLYPAKGATTKYYYGSVWPKFGAAGGTGSKETFSVDFQSESGPLSKNP